MVKLLADGFVLQLLSVELVYRPQGRRQVAAREVEKQSREEADSGRCAARKARQQKEAVGEGNKRRKDAELSTSMEQETPQLQGRSFPYAPLL